MTALTDDPKVAQRYAKAIFEQAEATGQLAAVAKDFESLQALFNDVSDLAHFFLNPGIPKIAKQDFLAGQFEGKVSPLVFNLLKLLLENDRLAVINGIAKKFLELQDIKNNVGWAKVITAAPLGTDHQKRLQQQLEVLFRYDTVNLENTVDPTILGGIRVEVGDKVIDGSYTSQLTQLQQLVRS